MLRSSYKNSVDYSEIFKTICFTHNPKTIIEFGILDGFSLKSFVDSCSPTTIIKAYDIFEEFNGNGANLDIVTEKFRPYPNVEIKYGDYYKTFQDLQDNSIDLLHVDIANNGDTYEFMFNHYVSKMKKGGIVLLEGGSCERDNIEWMKKYNKSSIVPVIEKYKTKGYEIKVISDFPSLTIVKI